jgi:hypothetical protein
MKIKVKFKDGTEHIFERSNEYTFDENCWELSLTRRLYVSKYICYSGDYIARYELIEE